MSGAVWLFYVVLGGLLVSADVRGAWLLQPTTLVDAAYRDQFVDTLSAQLRETFERRSEYLDLLRRRGVAVAPDEPA